MKPYTENASCPQCGFAAIAVVYHRRGMIYEGGWPCDRGDGPHLCRTCRRCGYRWMEAPLDARPDPPPGDPKEAP